MRKLLPELFAEAALANAAANGPPPVDGVDPLEGVNIGDKGLNGPFTWLGFARVCPVESNIGVATIVQEKCFTCL